ncbi:SusC/RagA family TonB-linked outer membrane protein [Olivibacter sitiensis]|uniref:SusC/RagA family TonB-linked outer membrane protein n=1 Tax=Olivibacter sitiensis TaxID=376470 RepID=UPI000419F941|nr:SusC/RagA family TonB-linked outer membrane protein [Olivibacter sitiensis]
MNRFLKLMIIFLLWLPASAGAQQIAVNCEVIDSETNAPVPGVNVTWKERGSLLATTDANGRFSVSIAPGTELTFSSLGYVTTNLPAKEGLRVILVPDNTTLDEVVVTGVAQGTDRKQLAFALTKVNTEQLATVPGVDASQSLRGKVAGIRIVQSTGNGSATVTLRGAKSVSGNVAPLIVVDGFVTNLSLSDLNPQDIESIEVVKGAAASALYGTRGEGGTIQVITKTGKGSSGLRLTLDNEVGISNVQRTPPVSEYHHFQVNADGSFVLNGTNRLLDYQDNGFSLNLHPYTHYYDNVGNMLNNNAFFSNTFSATAAGDKYNLYASFQNQHKGGVASVVDADTRKTAMFNFGYRPNQKLSVDLTLQYFNTVTPSSATTNSGAGSLLYATTLYEPFIYLRQRDENGKYAFSPDGFEIQKFNVDNPFYQLSYREYANNNDNVLGGAKLRYAFSQYLNAEVYGSIQNEYFNSEDYYPIGFQTLTANISRNNGYYGLLSSKVATKNAQAQINYQRRFNVLDLGVSLKSVYEDYRYTELRASGYNLSAPVKNLSAAAADTRSIGSDWSRTVNYGYFLNVKAGWKEKVFLDVLGRLDQSSRFGQDVATAFFPRASLAYRLTQDVDLGFVNELKLRAAYGQAGSLPPFNAKESRVELNSTGGVSYTQRANTDLKRAVTSEIELGIDAVVFNRINVQANYAASDSKNDFILVPAFSPTTGSAQIYDNLGAVKSHAWELEANGAAIQRTAFSWNVGITFSRVRSEITSLGNVPEFTSSNFRKAMGLSPFAYYGYSVLTSLDQLEVNADGLVTNAAGGDLRPDDFTMNSVGFVVLKSQLGTAAEVPLLYQNAATGNSKVIGDAQPDFILGLSNTFRWKSFSIYGLLDWQQGGLKYNMTQQYLTYQYRSPFSDETAQLGLPLAFTTGVFNAQQVTDYWLHKSSYLSLRELSVAYNLPRIGLFKNAVKSGRIAFVARNLYTWTDFTGVTPEGNMDFFEYPTYRIFSGKLTLNF